MMHSAQVSKWEMKAAPRLSLRLFVWPLTAKELLLGIRLRKCTDGHYLLMKQQLLTGKFRLIQCCHYRLAAQELERSSPARILEAPRKRRNFRGAYQLDMM
jgi:hypothetical protein